MAERSDIRKMIVMMHTPELQKVLGLLKLSKCGKKSELMGRLLAISHCLPKPVQNEIESLYRQRFYTTNCVNRTSSVFSSAVDSAFTSVDAYKAFNSTNGFVPQVSSRLPVHPDVKFKPLPFYDPIAVLLEPATLAPRTLPASVCQESSFSFYLTPEQALQIMEKNVKGSELIQIQLRFCWLETSCEQEDHFPPSLAVHVNNRVAQLPNPLPSNKQGVEPKRLPQPLNITSLCKINAVFKNQITVMWMPEHGRNYCMTVNCVQALNSSILLNRLRQNGIRHQYHTRALVKEKLAVDVDSEIATTSLRISLLCPLGKMRMKVPCRATTCNHLQCFDAPTYLQMNQKKAMWLCPVCDRPAEFQSLLIDGLFTEILQKVSNTNDIQFTEDGRWQPIDSKEEECWIRDSPTIDTYETTDISKSNGTDVIDLTETDEEDNNCTTTTTSLSQFNHSPNSYVVSTNKFQTVRSHDRSCDSPIVISVEPPSRQSLQQPNHFFYHDTYTNVDVIPDFPVPPPAHSKIAVSCPSKSFSRNFLETPGLGLSLGDYIRGAMSDQEFLNLVPPSSLRSPEHMDNCNLPMFP